MKFLVNDVEFCSDDKDFDVELIDKKIKTILSELTNNSIDDLKTIN